VNGKSGDLQIGPRSRPATVLMILAVAMVLCAFLFARPAGDPDPGMFTPQTVGEPVQVTVP
jgi:hypothetical protein